MPLIFDGIGFLPIGDSLILPAIKTQRADGSSPELLTTHPGPSSKVQDTPPDSSGKTTSSSPLLR